MILSLMIILLNSIPTLSIKEYYDWDQFLSTSRSPGNDVQFNLHLQSCNQKKTNNADIEYGFILEMENVHFPAGEKTTNTFTVEKYSFRMKQMDFKDFTRYEKAELYKLPVHEIGKNAELSFRRLKPIVGEEAGRIAFEFMFPKSNNSVSLPFNIDKNFYEGNSKHVQVFKVMHRESGANKLFSEGNPNSPTRNIFNIYADVPLPEPQPLSKYPEPQLSQYPNRQSSQVPVPERDTERQQKLIALIADLEPVGDIVRKSHSSQIESGEPGKEFVLTNYMTLTQFASAIQNIETQKQKISCVLKVFDQEDKPMFLLRLSGVSLTEKPDLKNGDSASRKMPEWTFEVKDVSIMSPETPQFNQNGMAYWWDLVAMKTSSNATLKITVNWTANETKNKPTFLIAVQFKLIMNLKGEKQGSLQWAIYFRKRTETSPWRARYIEVDMPRDEVHNGPKPRVYSSSEKTYLTINL